MINAKSRIADEPVQRRVTGLQWRHHRVARRSKQSAERHDRIAAGMQPIENARQRRNRLRTVASRIVQQDDAAISPLLFHPLNDDVLARFRPVLRIDIFQDDQIIQLLRNLQRHQLADLRGLSVGGVGRPEQRRCAAGN